MKNRRAAKRLSDPALQAASRREFLRRAAGAAAMAGVAPSAVRGVLDAGELGQSVKPVPANDKIQLALIGAGGQGMYDTRVALEVPGVELVAVADVYDGRLARSKEIWGTHIVTTRDHREVLARPDVDAVIIATPDHWHQKIAIDAMNAGKDVYVEKPMVQHAEEGTPLVETAAKTKRIVEVGSQRVSSIVYAKARQLFKAGAIGKLNLVEAYIDRNSALGAWQYSIPPDASPQTVDWDRFIGHAPKRPFEPIRLFRWRNYRDYGTGVAGDLFVHLFSGIHYVLDSIGPTRILATGGLRSWKDGRDVPDVMLAIFDYPETKAHPAFNMFLKVNLAAGSGEESTFDFVGDEGTLTIDGQTVSVAKKPSSKEPGYTIDTFAEETQKRFLELYRKQYPDKGPEVAAPEETETYAAPRGYSDSHDHFVNFFNAIRTRKPVIEDAAFGLRASGPAVLSNNSYFDRKVVHWNPETMRIVEEKPATSASSRD
jgi:predicted dehydrogenase